MWESDLAAKADIRTAVGPALALPHGQCGPLADAVGGQDRGAPRGRREKRGRRVRRMMIGEQDLVAGHPEMRRNDAANPDLLAQHVLYRMRERSPRARKGAQGTEIGRASCRERVLVQREDLPLRGKE